VPHANQANSSTAKSSHMPLEPIFPNGKRSKCFNAAPDPKNEALKRKSNEHHMQALVLAAMIAHQLGTRAAVRLGEVVGRAMVSYEKLYDLLASHLIKARDLAELCAFAPEPRYIKRDKRIRKSPVESGILTLG